MSDLFSSPSHLVAALLAWAHSLFAGLGLDPASGLAWCAAIAVLVVTIRTALLPIAVHGVRFAHASAAARPGLAAVRARYSGRTDLESLRAMRAEQRTVQAEHGVGRLGCLPLLLQLPVLWALYDVLSKASNGQAIGLMDAALVASAGSASILGVRLADRLGGLTVVADPRHLVVVGALALVSAGLTYVTQRAFVLPNTVTDGMPDAMVDAQRLMPSIASLGVLLSAGVVPVGLLVYWLASNLYTLAQQWVVCRWFPTPGTAAHTALQARRATA